jgi:glycosyltransferase involved in cell wall biosynthesis
MPISLLEMLSAGLRLIATDVGGVAEIITSDVDGQLIPKHDVHELAKTFNSITKKSDIKSKNNEYKWNELFSPQTYNSKLLNYAKD